MSIVSAAKNIFANAKSLAAVREILRKSYFRISPERDTLNVDVELEHLVSDFDAWAKDIDEAAYNEAVLFNSEHVDYLGTISERVGIPMGGAAHLTLCYFLVRVFDPKVVVETGVAAGHSSRAFLSALRKNGNGGLLYSSDFPYLTEKDAEEYIGIVVEDELRSNWQLMVEGDRTNLNKIAGMVPGNIDFLHYDSDKTKNGRNFALEALKGKLAKGSVIVFDDIQDNDHFLIWSKDFKNRKIFRIDNKYVGKVII